jgi:hypothetical protein
MTRYHLPTNLKKKLFFEEFSTKNKMVALETDTLGQLVECFATQ